MGMFLKKNNLCRKTYILRHKFKIKRRLCFCLLRQYFICILNLNLFFVIRRHGGPQNPAHGDHPAGAQSGQRSQQRGAHQQPRALCAINAKNTVVIGDNELDMQKVAIKNMKTSNQVEVPIGEILSTLTLKK